MSNTYSQMHPVADSRNTAAVSDPKNIASSLTANSMKYLRHTPTQGNVTSFGQKSGSNASAHSNVLLKAQNAQNRNDSFGMHSNYSNPNQSHLGNQN